MVDETGEKRMDIDTAHAEARSIKQILKPVSEHFKTQNPESDFLNDLPENSTFWYELADQEIEAIKKTSPDAYEAILSAEDAIGSIAGREGEKMAEHLKAKMLAEMNEATGTRKYSGPDEIAGIAVGKVVKGTKTDISTRTDLFRFGISLIEGIKTGKTVHLEYDMEAASEKQDKYDQSSSQEGTQITSPGEPLPK